MSTLHSKREFIIQQKLFSIRDKNYILDPSEQQIGYFFRKLWTARATYMLNDVDDRTEIVIQQKLAAIRPSFKFFKDDQSGPDTSYLGILRRKIWSYRQHYWFEARKSQSSSSQAKTRQSKTTWPRTSSSPASFSTFDAATRNEPVRFGPAWCILLSDITRAASHVSTLNLLQEEDVTTDNQAYILVKKTSGTYIACTVVPGPSEALARIAGAHGQESLRGDRVRQSPARTVVIPPPESLTRGRLD